MDSQRDTQDIEQYLLNRSYDPVFRTLVFQMMQFDGTNLQRETSKSTAKKITSSGSYLYVASAPPGTAQSSPKWQAKRIESTGNDTIITWADGDTDFNNVATDLTVLSYS